MKDLFLMKLSVLLSSRRFHRAIFVLLLFTLWLSVSGCRTLSFYSQAVKGQYQLLAQRQPISDLLADPHTPQILRDRLLLVQQLRGFARTHLSLHLDGHYEHYVDLKREFVVWNVQAAPEFSLQAKTWWYPVVGSLDYRGYFSLAGARAYGEWLKQRRDYDVYYGAASAYSTLGWFRDPVLNTFLFEPDPELAEVLFHELGHQEVFAAGDTDFNEAFATTVGQEGTRRWLKSQGHLALQKAYETALRRNQQFVQLVMTARSRLEQLYGDTRDDEGRLRASRQPSGLTPDQLREQKGRIIDQLRADYETVKMDWNGYSGYDLWFNGPINNAKLNAVATYYDLVPGFERLLALNQNELPAFYREARRLAKMPKMERRQWLRNLAKESTVAPASSLSFTPSQTALPHTSAARTPANRPAAPQGPRT